MRSSVVKILHIEDDPMYASLVQAMLKADSLVNHYDIVHVESLKQALNQLKDKGFGAVLLDLSLGDVSGLDNVRAIKEENPDLPIIVVTGLDNETIALKALEQGAQDVIVKGYASDKVIRMAITSSIQRKTVERDLYRRANFDELTGLANREHFMAQLQRSFNAAKRWNYRETVLIIEVDNLTAVNEAHGFEAGDTLLKSIAATIKNVLRSSDLIARYGSSEFAVLLDDRNDPEWASASIIAKLQDAFILPFTWKGDAIIPSINTSISLFPESGNDAKAIMENAQLAMGQSRNKEAGKFFYVKDRDLKI